MKIDYDKETNTVTVTVRELIDFLCRSGDIGAHPAVTAEEGKRAHKRAEDGSDSAMLEVPLELVTEYDGINYRLVGRADMIIPGDDCDTIEELKTTPSTFYGGTANIPPAHIAQCVLYAFMWCSGTGRGSAAVRITYIPKKDGRERSFECLFSKEELRAEASSLLAGYARWVRLGIEREEMRPATVKSMRFPYGEVRDGQVEFMTAVMRAARQRGRLLIQAPTGIGKTMAALYPSVKALGAGYADRIFYLTAKTSIRLAAEDGAASLLASSGSLRAISLLARERLCPEAEALRSGAVCSADFCARARGHYDRVGEALWELIGVLGAGKVLTPTDVTAVAERHRVCPYELSLDASEFCDIIICDYNYVFDPRVYLRRFFDDFPEAPHREEKYVLLCDEAHNLVDRAREMFSASIKLSDIERMLPGTEGSDELHGALVMLSDCIRDLRSQCEEITLDSNGRERGFYVGGDAFSEIVSAASKAADECGREAYYKRISENEADRRLSRELSALRRLLSAFALSAEGFDRRHTAYAEVFDGDIKCSHICLDASEHLALRMRRASAVILFSATLEPPDYFARVLGCRDYSALELSSPYDESNLCLLAADKISTRMADREVSAPEIAAMIYAVAMAKTGNYICYLPSYQYLELIVREFEGRYRHDGIDTVVQKRRMSERERGDFLSEFAPDPQRTKVGFCVLGGVFSEGVDLPGDRLSGAVIVGVGLPQLSAESNLLRDYYERVCERGYEFAYVFPGMNKVLQAAGRVIRGENDRGVVLLIDDRFGSQDYRALFPSHWRGLREVGDRHSLGMALKQFWSFK